MTPEEVEEVWKSLIDHLAPETILRVIHDLNDSFSMTWDHCREYAPSPHLAILVRMLQKEVDRS